MLIPAYNDKAGVTAAFNLNLLVRLNREADADFDLNAFSHRAIWNPTDSRIEMHLISRCRAGCPCRPQDHQIRGERNHPYREQLQIHARGFRGARQTRRMARLQGVDGQWRLVLGSFAGSGIGGQPRWPT